MEGENRERERERESEEESLIQRDTSSLAVLYSALLICLGLGVSVVSSPVGK